MHLDREAPVVDLARRLPEVLRVVVLGHEDDGEGHHQRASGDEGDETEREAARLPLATPHPARVLSHKLNLVAR